jgi:hypothetical protein
VSRSVGEHDYLRAHRFPPKQVRASRPASPGQEPDLN